MNAGEFQIIREFVAAFDRGAPGDDRAALLAQKGELCVTTKRLCRTSDGASDIVRAGLTGFGAPDSTFTLFGEHTDCGSTMVTASRGAEAKARTHEVPRRTEGRRDAQWRLRMSKGKSTCACLKAAIAQ